jgi:hypothetical protein
MAAALLTIHSGMLPNTFTTPLHGLQATLSALGILDSPESRNKPDRGRAAHWARIAARAPQIAVTMRRYVAQIAISLRPGNVALIDTTLRHLADLLEPTAARGQFLRADDTGSRRPAAGVASARSATAFPVRSRDVQGSGIATSISRRGPLGMPETENDEELQPAPLAGWGLRQPSTAGEERGLAPVGACWERA